MRVHKQARKILIIEDDPDVLNAMNIALASLGFDVEVLLSGKCILENKFTVPDLFILEKRLPDVDGLEVCKYLKSKPQYRNVPIIMISTSSESKEKALASGVTYFLEKPFVMQELLDTVKKIVKSSGQ